MSAGVEEHPPRQMLGEAARRVWRAVAAAGQRGTTLGQLVERFRGVYDYHPVRDALRSLHRGHYIAYRGEKRWGTWAITDRVPLNEQRPAWLDEPPDADEAPPPAAESAARTEPYSVFTLATEQPAPPAAAAAPAPKPSDSGSTPAPQAPAQALHGVFALHSTGELHLVFDRQYVRMPPAVTRSFFAWLDRLGGTSLARITEEHAS